MNLLLTSSGLSSQPVVRAFKSMHTKPLGKLKVAFIITAALAEGGDKRWLFDDLQNLYKTGVGEVDIVDIASVPKPVLYARLEWADCIFASGGNTAYLMYCYEKFGLVEQLPQLLKTRTYVGISAGSMVVGYRMPLMLSQQVYPEDTHAVYPAKQFLQWHNFVFVPHFGAERLSNLNDSFLGTLKERAKRPVYAINDGAAILVTGNTFKVVGSPENWRVV